MSIHNCHHLIHQLEYFALCWISSHCSHCPPQFLIGQQDHPTFVIANHCEHLSHLINQLFNQLVSKIINQSWLLIIIVNKIISQSWLLIIVNIDRLIASTLVFIKPLPSLSNSLKASFNSCFCSIDITELLLMIIFSWTL